MVTEKLRQFDNRRKAIIRHKIQTIIFEEQMQLFNEPTPPPPKARKIVTPSFPSSIEGSRNSANIYGSPIYQSFTIPPSSKNDQISPFFYSNIMGGNITKDSEHQFFFLTLYCTHKTYH